MKQNWNDKGGKMEYVYAALLLYKAGKDINEENLKKVLEAAGVEVDEAKVKALVSALEEVDIEEAINKAASVGVAVATMPTGGEAPAQGGEEKKEEKKEEPKEEEVAAGLSALFG